MYLPIGKSAKADLEKIKFEDIAHNISAKKGMEGLEISTNYEEMERNVAEITQLNTGDSESIDQSEHKDEYYSYGHVRKDYRQKQAEAAAEFKYIKQGAANGGGIGNATRHILSHTKGKEGIRIACNIYHGVVQVPLDSKHSTHDSALIDSMYQQLRSWKDPGVRKLQSTLSRFLGQEEVDALIEMSYLNGKWQGGITQLTNKLVPFSRLLYRGNLVNIYRAAAQPEKDREHSVATMLAAGL